MKPSDLEPERWHRIDEVFDAALDRPPAERQDFLDEACGDDTELRRHVEALLEAHGRQGSALDTPASAIGAAILTRDAGLEDIRLGPFLVKREIGRGGMGVVYLAEDTRLGRTVALKVLPPYVSADDRAQHRFLSEARAVSALDHANIATLYEIDITDAGQPYMAFAFYEGKTLDTVLRDAPLSPGRARDVALQIAAGLSAAHAKKIIHRDIKPSNVLLTETGQVKLLDFGVAKIADEDVTGEGVPIGTVAYMSPEQAAGRPLDARTDLWSLGVLLYEMLSGGRPFRSDDYMGLVQAIINKPPGPLPESAEAGGLEPIVARLLRKSPDERYPHANALIRDLEAVRAGHAPPSTSLRRAPGRRPGSMRGIGHPGRWVAAGLIGTAAIALGWTLTSGPGARGPAGVEDSSDSPTSGPATSGRAYDPQATEAVLLGRSHRNRRSVDDLALARQYYGRALDIDSTDARAYAGLADTYISAAQWGFATPQEGYPRARELAHTALRHDSLSAAGHASLAAVAFNYDWSWEEAVRLARRAIDLDPSHVESYRPLIQSLSILGREEEAAEIARQADTVARLPDEQSMRLVFQRYLRHDFADAAEHARAVLAFNPRIWQARMLLGLSLAELGDADSALRSAEGAATDSERASVALGALGYVYAVSGRRADAETVIAELRRLADGEWINSSRVAMVYGALGERDLAFRWLDRAFEERDVLLLQIRDYPFFDPLRSDPRLDELLGRMDILPIGAEPDRWRRRPPAERP